MSHTIRDKKKLLGRVRRVQGQLAAVERMLTDEADPYETLQLVASCRGALNGLMFQIIEGHVMLHVVDPARKPSPGQLEAANQLVEVIRSYLK
jgi:DNA-binding FrmR family transcriptional regulator